MRLGAFASGVVALLVAASCATLAGTRGAGGPRLVRTSDGAVARFVWYMRGSEDTGPPPEPDLLIAAIWADGFALTRPGMLAAELHVVQLDPADVERWLDGVWRAAEAVPASERVVPALLDRVDGAIGVRGHDLADSITLVGWVSETDSSARAAVFAACQEPMDVALGLDGPAWDGSPGIRWETP